MTSIDIVIPSYNYGRYLKAAVGSVLSQTGVELRVLIVDDCSTDDTPAIAQAIVASDPRVSYVRNEKNSGHIATFNRGIMGWAKADALLLISADDVLAEGALRRACDIFDANPDVGLVCGLASVFVNDQAPVYVENEGVAAYQVIEGSKFIERMCLFGNPVPSPVVIVRTSLQHELGGYHPEMLHTSDMEMWMRFATRSRIALVNAVQAYYRVHQSNMSSGYFKRAVGDREERIFTCQHVLDHWGAGIPGFAGWVQTMKTGLSTEALYQVGLALELGRADDCAKLEAFALKHTPGIMRTPAGMKHRMKQMLGEKGLRMLRNWTEGAPLGAPGELHVHGQVLGWWPAPEKEKQCFNGRETTSDVELPAVPETAVKSLAG